MEEMRLPSLRRNRQQPLPGVTGTVRLDRRTKNLTKRLRPGDIAVVDHLDIDRVSAEALVACRVAAVINVAPSISGRYPNLGPEILVGAGVPLLDIPAPPESRDPGDPAQRASADRRDADNVNIFAAVREGESLRVDNNAVYRDDQLLAHGTLLTKETVQEAMDEARAGLSIQLEAFAGNTMEYLRQERDLLLDGVGVPEIRTSLEGRQVLIVVRGYHYREDLATLRPYLREYRPVMIGVDGGADALLEAGYRPNIIVGDMDSVSDAALASGAELVVHAYRDGRAPGLERLERLGLPTVVFPATGTSEDVAMLLADDKGADLIVAVGGHYTIGEFLDKGRAGMASTFLTRLRVGSKLVDAKGVSRLYRSRISTSSLFLLVAATLVTLIVAVLVSPVGRAYVDILGDLWGDFWFWVQGIF
jgi:uncharacterized membrane-anchored protein